MCYDVDETSDVWHEEERTCRRVRQCELCCMRILPGVRYCKISALNHGRWDHFDVHADCYELTKFVQLTICEQHGWTIVPGDLRSEVDEHRHDARVISRYRLVVRARMREGVWPNRLGVQPESRA